MEKYYKATKVDGVSFKDKDFVYHIGQNIDPKAIDRKLWAVCIPGIHLAKSLMAVKRLEPRYEEIYEAEPGVILGEDNEKVRCASCVIIRKLEPGEYKPMPEGLPENSLCGIDWLKEHAHDLDDWTPTIEIIQPGSRQTFTIKDPKIMKEAVKVMREGNKRARTNKR